MGMTLKEALSLTDRDIAEALGGLPPEKLHCSNHAATVLHLAIQDYYTRERVARLPYADSRHSVAQ
jgi:nitrogen fixation NifU-like protein